MRVFMKGIGIGLFASLAVVGTPSHAAFTNRLSITALDVGNGSMLIIEFGANVTGCTVNRVYVPMSANYYESMLAMALSAYASGRPISVWINSCSDPAGDMLQAFRIIM